MEVTIRVKQFSIKKMFTKKVCVQKCTEIPAKNLAQFAAVCLHTWKKCKYCVNRNLLNHEVSICYL